MAPVITRDRRRALGTLAAQKPLSWLRGETSAHLDGGICAAVVAAQRRFGRFEPWVADHYGGNGAIESPLRRIPSAQRLLEDRLGRRLRGTLWVKRDDALPISGSIKARGGIHEVFRLAEEYPGAKPGLVVCSTGNLGLSIGTVGPALGFNTEVHMSADAKQWKKDRLRAKGARVVEHRGQFSEVIVAARAAAQKSGAVFVDDEDSLGLLAGYAVAGERLRQQFTSLALTFTDTEPLHVYLPCGVGGGPGGVTFGLKRALGSAVRCHIVEPVTCPSMAIGQATGRGAQSSCADLGISGATVADGLAVQRPSPLVSEKVAHLFAGFHTVTDSDALALTHLLDTGENILAEPSAAISLAVPWRVDEPGTHLVWLTGGSLIPAPDRDALRRAAAEAATSGTA